MGVGVVVILVCSVYKLEFEVVIVRVINVFNFFLLAINILCFLLVKIFLILLLIICKFENLGVSYF